MGREKEKDGFSILEEDGINRLIEMEELGELEEIEDFGEGGSVEGGDADSEAYETELLRLEEERARKQEEREEEGESGAVREIYNRVTKLIRLRMEMENTGTRGSVCVGEYPMFLGPLEGGWRTLAEATHEAEGFFGREMEEINEMAGRQVAERGRGKQVKFLVKKGVEKKQERMREEYEDRQFFGTLCRAYCYERGISLEKTKMAKNRDRARVSKKRSISYEVHGKLVGFSAPRGEYEWEEQKMNEFFSSLLQ